MVTIKDIAREAGVSQGTVSNVLNGKGNISVEKIKLVQSTANRLGYMINLKARNLRKGYSKTLALLLPNIKNKLYNDFYLSFMKMADRNGYTVDLYLSDDLEINELAQLESLRSEMVSGVATFSSCKSDASLYTKLGFSTFNTLFVERKLEEGTNHIGFDYHKAGTDIAKEIKKSLRAGQTIAFISESTTLSHQKLFKQGFNSQIKDDENFITFIETDINLCQNQIFNLLSSKDPYDYFICSNPEFAEQLAIIKNAFYRDVYCKRAEMTFSISPLLSMPKSECINYQMNYRLMGKQAAEFLIANIDKKQNDYTCTLENDGIRTWKPSRTGGKDTADALTILTLDSPVARNIEQLARYYTLETGIKIKIALATFDNIYETLSNLKAKSYYDIIRLDATWMPYFASKIFVPLEEIDTELGMELKTFISGLSPYYTSVDDVVYAFPGIPSTQMLFYRKDIFEDPIYQRMYKERMKKDLVPPRTFDEFNKIAQFFTKKYNPDSPIQYGATLTLGNCDVAGTEFLTRFFSYQPSLFKEDDTLDLQGPHAIKSLQDVIALREFSAPTFNMWWRDTATAFAQGNIAMTILYTNYAAELVKASSRVSSVVGYAPVPGGRPLLGGSSLGINRYSKNQQMSLDFIRWLTKDEVATALMKLGGVSAKAATYENYEIIDQYPWLPSSIEAFPSYANRRSPKTNPAEFDERLFIQRIGNAVLNVYNDILGPEQALEEVVASYR